MFVSSYYFKWKFWHNEMNFFKWLIQFLVRTSQNISLPTKKVICFASILIFELLKMTKGLTRLASHNSNIVATHKQSYDGGWAIYCAKSAKERMSKHWRRVFPFLINFWMTPLPPVIFPRPPLSALRLLVPRLHMLASWKGLHGNQLPPWKQSQNIFIWG